VTYTPPIALDTNILAYAEGVNGTARQEAALDALRAIAGAEIVLPVQVLAELFAVLTRKAKWPAAAARRAVLGWMDSYLVADTTPAVLIDAMELVALHRQAPWDAMMLAAAAQAGCGTLLSEDMQDGFRWRGVTVRNPLRTAPRH
jgi:predicted nucleic acid-binding protein